MILACLLKSLWTLAVWLESMDSVANRSPVSLELDSRAQIAPKITAFYACPMHVLCGCNAGVRILETKRSLRLYFAGKHHSSSQSHRLLIMHAWASVAGVGGLKCHSGSDSKDFENWAFVFNNLELRCSSLIMNWTKVWFEHHQWFIMLA